MVTISDMTNEQMNKRTGQPNMYCLCRQCQHKNNEKRLNLITAELSSGPITACERSSGENTVKSEKALWNRHVIQTGMKKRESNGCWVVIWRHCHYLIISITCVLLAHSLFQFISQSPHLFLQVWNTSLQFVAKNLQRHITLAQDLVLTAPTNFITQTSTCHLS